MQLEGPLNAASGNFRSTWSTQRAGRLVLLAFALKPLFPSEPARTQSTTLPTATAADPITVSGRVINALTGAPIPRALVNLNGRAVLTDALGRFEFPQFTSSASGASSTTLSGYLQVSKPGFAASLDAMEGGQQQVADLSAALELKLYPDALITGIITGSDRQPLAKVQLMLYREIGDESGRRLAPVGFASTDSHGEYRFDEPPGRYALSLRYSPRSPETGEAVLPQRFPEQTSSDTASSFKVGAGEERKIDLQARTGLAYPVTFQADTGSDRPMNIRLLVRPSVGSSFTVFAQPTRTPGELRIELPSGTYQLRGIEQNRDSRLEAEGRVTVAGRAVAGLVLHFADVATLPVQVLADTSTTNSANPLSASFDEASLSLPSPQSLNLQLRKVGESEEDGMTDIRPTPFPDKSFAFQAGAGRYRLAVQGGGGGWYVEKATYGTTDLLRQSLTVASGAGGEAIRVVVSNATGQVTGTIRRRGTASAGWVYLMPHEPSLTSVYTARAAADGTYTRTVPPGTYSVIAFDHRFAGNLGDPDTFARLQGGGTTQVTAGAKAALDLELQTVESVE
jgi:hypothetical protein